MIAVTCELRLYESDGSAPVGAYDEAFKLQVCSHLNQPNLVVLKLHNGMSVTVSRTDLEAAITNATNTARYAG